MSKQYYEIFRILHLIQVKWKRGLFTDSAIVNIFHNQITFDLALDLLWIILIICLDFPIKSCFKLI
jgi:hypothetical protein